MLCDNQLYLHQELESLVSYFYNFISQLATSVAMLIKQVPNYQYCDLIGRHSLSWMKTLFFWSFNSPYLKRFVVQSNESSAFFLK